MESIKHFLKKPKFEKITERGELLRYFLQTLNISRLKAGYKPLTFPRVAHLVGGLDKSTLYYMKSVMKDMDPEKASKWFYWSLRPQEES